MHTTTKLAGAAAVACAACCAIPLVPALIGGAGLLVTGAAMPFWAVAALALTLPLASLLVLSRRKTLNAGSFSTLPSHAGGCGCGEACASESKIETPIACTLDAADFKARTQLIHALSSHHLVAAKREELTLRLTYTPDAFDAVQELVSKERVCCAFLDFNLKRDRDGVHLKITAPKEATEAADLLFAHFTPSQNSKHMELAQ
ncbi:hypothetical protein ASG42_11135 [Rhizobium sp. Leaf391]|nr:hypothetical protein ASG42_11135 [Rhizobium sp. Leaf391]